MYVCALEAPGGTLEEGVHVANEGVSVEVPNAIMDTPRPLGNQAFALTESLISPQSWPQFSKPHFHDS